MSGPVALRALLLAGRREGEPDPIARDAGVSCKALAPVAGAPLIEWSLAALLACPRIASIDIALAPQARLPTEAPRLARWLDEGRIRRVAPAASPARTVAAALAGLPADEPLLVSTADHALLSPVILEQFLDRCEAPEVDAYAALLPLDLLEARYPDMRRTGLKLRGRRYAGCNLFRLRNAPGARSLVSFWIRLEALRKSPLRMALAVGPSAVVGYGLRLLNLSQALALIGKRTGARLAPALLDIPEAAIDVDTRRDLAFAEALLAQPAARLDTGDSPPATKRSGSG